MSKRIMIDIQSVVFDKHIDIADSDISECEYKVFVHESQEPIWIVALQSGLFYVFDGQQRLLAAKELGWTHIDALVFTLTGATKQLTMMINKIIKDRPLKLSEIGRYSATMIFLEEEKRHVYPTTIHERMPIDYIVRKRLGLDGVKLLRQAQYLIAHAKPELCASVENGEITISDAITKLQQDKSSNKKKINTIPNDTTYTGANESPENKKRKRGRKSKESRIALLEEQLEREYYRANTAEANLRELQERQQNQIYHRDSIIASLKARVKELET